jgi:hypothetical protein
MNNQFDELTKSLAQSVTRRAALKKFGAGLAGMALAAFGLAGKAGAAGVRRQGYCQVRNYGSFDHSGTHVYTGMCKDPHGCVGAPSTDCPAPGTAAGKINAFIGCGGVFTPLDLGKACNFTI